MIGISRKRVGIADRIGLARLIRRALDRQFDGSQSQAAEASGIPQYQLSRLLNLEQKLDAITPETREQLDRLVGPEGEEELQTMFLSPRAEQFLAIHRGWVARALQRIWKGTGLGWWGWSSTTRGVAKRTLTRRQVMEARRDWLASLQAVVRSQLPDQCSRFEQGLRVAGHRRDRIELAYARILEPLLDSLESGFLERGWYEIKHADQLREFVECGMRREEILLARESDIQRAHRVSRLKSAKEFRTSYGADGGDLPEDVWTDAQDLSHQVIDGSTPIADRRRKTRRK